jgi:two-component system, OmpR family, heavy metal sensor histidine kinase CusS
MRLTLRWRLTLWNTLALAVVLFGFSALVYALVAHALYERVDDTLLGQLRVLEEQAKDPRMEANVRERLAYWLFEFREHEKTFGVVFEASGNVLERTEELAADSVPPAPKVLPGERRFEDLSLPFVGRQRVLDAGVYLAGRDFAVCFLAPLEDVDRELAELLEVLGVALPAALLLAAALGYLLARKALEPMDQLRRQTEEITADRLDRRLPVAHPSDELGRLTRTINAMIARLEQSFREVRRFTADASHELRTPLAVLRTEAEVALNKPLSATDNQQLLGSILEECERLTRLTDQLLTLAREDAGGAGPVVRATIDLPALVLGAAETMRALADARGVTLHAEADGPLPVWGDEARLRQVFYNLVDNAIKYTPPGGRVEVAVARQDGAAVVRIRDTGIGIPAEHLPRVFDRFYRVDKARSRAEGGTGLGLSIAHSIVAAHDGHIELTSTPGEGTTCIVTLPLTPSG